MADGTQTGQGGAGRNDHAARQLARDIADLRKKVDKFMLSAQMTSSTVPVNGEDVPVATGIARGAEAFQISEETRQELADAKAALEAADEALAQAGAERDEKIALAQSDAQIARDAAVQANISVLTKPSVTYSEDPPSGYEPHGSLWFQTDETGEVIAVWQQVSDPDTLGNNWTERPLRDEVLASLSVGKLVAGDAAVDSLVAEKIAASTAAFQEVQAGNIVAGTAAFDEAVAQKIFAESVVAGMVTADEFIGENAILTGSITSDKLVANAVTAEKIAAESITADKIAAGAIETSKLSVGALSSNRIPFPNFDSIDPWDVTASGGSASIVTVNGEPALQLAKHNGTSMVTARARNSNVADAQGQRILRVSFTYRFPQGASVFGGPARIGIYLDMPTRDTMYPFGRLGDSGSGPGWFENTSSSGTGWLTASTLVVIPAGTNQVRPTLVMDAQTGGLQGADVQVQLGHISIEAGDENTLITPSAVTSLQLAGEDLSLTNRLDARAGEFANRVTARGALTVGDATESGVVIDTLLGNWNIRFPVDGSSSSDEFVDLSNIRKWNAASSDTGWTNITSFTNGFSAGNYTPQYRKIGPVVYLRGEVYRSSAPTSTTSAFTLPAGFRPSNGLVFGTGAFFANGTQPTIIQVGGQGVVAIQCDTARTSSPGYSLAGVSYPTD